MDALFLGAISLLIVYVMLEIIGLFIRLLFDMHHLSFRIPNAKMKKKPDRVYNLDIWYDDWYGVFKYEKTYRTNILLTTLIAFLLYPINIYTEGYESVGSIDVGKDIVKFLDDMDKNGLTLEGWYECADRRRTAIDDARKKKEDEINERIDALNRNFDLYTK